MTLTGALRYSFSVLFWAFFAVSSAVLFVGAVVIFLVTAPFDRNGRLLHLYSCFWAQIYFYCNPLWHLKVERRDCLPWRGGAVLVANHESLGDILVLFGLYRPFKWVSKAENFKLPLLGWNMRLNRYVPLVRGNSESIGRMMADCERWLDRGVPIMMFPEGTRSPDGQIKAFKDGAFKLAIDKRVPVIPIVLVGTGRTLPKHGLILDTSAHCRVRVLPPLDPAPFAGDVVKLRDAVREQMVAEKAAMEHEQGARPRTR